MISDFAGFMLLTGVPTVTVTLLLVTPSALQYMVAVPFFTALTLPEEETLATLEFDVYHFKVLLVALEGDTVVLKV